MDQNFALFDLNKKPLHVIFKKHLGHEKRLIVPEYQKFCKIARICPDLISIAELRAVISRIANAISISKVSFSFDDFEKSLKEIAIISYKGPISERVKSFFLQIVPRCQTKYGVDFNLTGKKEAQVIFKKIQKVSNTSISSLNDSGSGIDLNIKEALETLKLSDSMRTSSVSPLSESDKSGRRARKFSFSSRSESGSPLGKLFMSPRNSLKPIKTFKLPIKTEEAPRSGKISPEKNKNPAEPGELDEFIQTEQSILNEVATVTVSLAKPRQKIKLDIDLSKTEDPKPETLSERTSSLELEKFPSNENGKKVILEQIKKISPIRDCLLPPAPEPVHVQNPQVTIEKGSSLETMKLLLENFKNKKIKKVNKPKPIRRIYKDFGKFIRNERKFTFSKNFVLGIIINAWRSEAAKSKASKAQPSQLRQSLNKLKIKK